MIKNWPKTNLGKERVCLLYFHITMRHWGKSGQELGIQRQQLKQRPQSKAAYWLTFYSLLSLLSYASQDELPRVASLSVSLVLSDQLPIKKKKMPHKHAHKPFSWMQSLRWDFFLGDSNCVNLEKIHPAQLTTLLSDHKLSLLIYPQDLMLTSQYRTLKVLQSLKN